MPQAWDECITNRATHGELHRESVADLLLVVRGLTTFEGKVAEQPLLDHQHFFRTEQRGPSFN